MGAKIFSHKGLSTVVSAVIMVALVLVAASIVWVTVNKMIKDETSSASSCFQTAEKVYIDRDNTCYNSTSNEIKLYIGVKDIEVNSILVSVAGESGAKSFEISSSAENTFLKMYDNSEVRLPDRNSGLVYIVGLSTFDIGKASNIKVAPTINGKQCETSDILSNLEDCRIFS
jgi:hypothetical protein